MPSECDATRRQFLQAALSSAVFTAGSDAKPASPGFETLAEFAVHSDEHLVVPLTIAGKEYPVVVDTGSQMSVFDDSLVSILGPALEREIPVNGEASAKAYLWPKARLGSMELSMVANAFVVSMNLQRIREAMGADVGGILGFDWLKWQILQVDFRDARLRFLRSAPQRQGIEIPLEINDNRAFLHAVLPELGEVRLLLDTGFDGLIDLPAAEFERLKENKLLKRVTSRTNGATKLTGRTLSPEQGILDCVKISDQRYAEVLVYSDRVFNPNDDGSTHDYSGLLGLEFLSEHTVTFDFPNKRMYLSERSRNDRPPTKFGGVACVRRKGRTIVAQIDNGSPWRRTGLAVGDEIVLLDGKLACEERLSALAKSLGQTGKHLLLRAYRNGQFHEFSVLINAE